MKIADPFHVFQVPRPEHSSKSVISATNAASLRRAFPPVQWLSARPGPPRLVAGYRDKPGAGKVELLLDPDVAGLIGKRASRGAAIMGLNLGILLEGRSGQPIPHYLAPDVRAGRLVTDNSANHACEGKSLHWHRRAPRPG